MSALPSAKPGALITEIVVQGVRRFGDVRRFTLGPGYNVFYGLSAAGKTTLYDVLRSLLFANGDADEAALFKSLLPAGQAACRAGMTLSVGGETFRLLKDYQQNAVTLSRLTADRKFELVYSDSAAIQQWLSAHARLTVGPSFGKLFTLTKMDFPSTTEGAVIPGLRRDVDTNFEDRLRQMSLADKRSTLAQLLDEFRRHADVKTTEFLQDGLRQKMFEVDALIRKRDEANEKLSEIAMELDPIEKVPKLPDGFEGRLESYKRQEKQREGELADLHMRQDDAHARLAAVIPAPFTEEDLRAMHSPQEMVIGILKKDFILDGGLASLLIGVVCATFFHRPVNIVGLILLVVGVALVVWRGLLVFLKAKEQFDVLRKDVDAIDEQVRVIEKKWDIETTVIRNLMKAYGVDDPREMREIEKKRDDLVAQRKAQQEILKGLVLANGEKDLDAAKTRFVKQIEQIDHRLQEISGNFTVDPKDLEPQIERLDREVARAEGRKPTARGKLFGREEDIAAQAAAEQQGGGFTATIEAWCKARNADLGRLLRSMQEAYAKNLRAVSGNKFVDAVFDAEGFVTVREEGKAPIPFESLDPTSKDAAYAALRLTLFQLETRGSMRLVSVLDDPFEFEEPRLALLSRALKALGPDAQVIHLTARPQHVKLADSTLEI